MTPLWIIAGPVGREYAGGYLANNVHIDIKNNIF